MMTILADCRRECNSPTSVILNRKKETETSDMCVYVWLVDVKNLAGRRFIELNGARPLEYFYGIPFFIILRKKQKHIQEKSADLSSDTRMSSCYDLRRRNMKRHV